MAPDPTTAPTPPSPNPGQAEPVIRERKISNINTIRVWEEEQHQHATGEKHHPEKHPVEKPPPDHSEAKKAKVRKSAQFLSAAAANMGAFTLGTVMAWSATGGCPLPNPHLGVADCNFSLQRSRPSAPPTGISARARRPGSDPSSR